MTYCRQFRQKILNDIANGETWRAVAKRYKISKFTVYSWIKNPHPKGFTERKPSKIDDEALLKDIEQYPDDYQWERARRFNCSQSAICYALKRLKITHKKRLTNIQKPTQRKESTFKNK
ncbi:IS630 transposase-related protein [Suttonella ornithocola]|uniref:Transposase and inactivated derivatives n=2 Tax=Suttonella ornithocola TaxID=279832 RepID=A0A380MYA3_9GAMM|nr:IS630 transposase-related protein [Suttonella ornithocola]SUO93629.1 Transposase and inactivated derivatives [Suttonella ornithocola]SUO94202.1 Transposase and inactivated derivatives [Suttonella ornithocola]SUO95329.1 Transposase and inactivated derivatives [Suttonella ornithocola]SUO95593.1 Transposase and inactivated derivatives [Suttonella ornithocola]SUO96523.1 Transposase and inactivated derivatives [Suttonella ornithocola]